MKRLKATLIATLILTTSQVSMAQNGSVSYGQPIATQSAAASVTSNVRARATVLKTTKVKLLRSKPQRIVVINDWVYEEDDDDALITPYRREDLVKLEPLDDLPEHIRWRLFLARQLALLKHRQVHG